MIYKLSVHILMCFIYLAQIKAIAQVVPELDLPRTEYSAVAPEIAKFGKYGDVPVDLSTGRINYTIPLYTIKIDDQEFPITLSYNFNGLKNEIPGSAGIGWDLMVGGSLSIQNQGGNDGQYNTHIADKVLPVLTNFASCFPEELGDKYLELLKLPDITTNGNAGDTEPDRFLIRSPYISATFYKNHLDNYIFIPHENYKVTRQDVSGLTRGYTVLDDLGTEFIFHSRNSFGTNVETAGGETISIPSTSYKLSQINLSAQRGSLNFVYNANRSFSSIKRTYSRNYLKINTGGQTYASNPISQNFSTALSGTGENLLTNIYFPNGEVEFTYSQGRIASINVWVVKPGGAKILLISYGFVFDSQGYLLEKITKHSRTGSQEPFYDFQYHSPVSIGNLGEDDLGTDAWGYLNGRPHTYPTPDFANKIPTYDSSLPGALKKIIYPTGGSTTIDYEANTVNGILYPYDAPNKTSTTYQVNSSARASTPDTNNDVEFFTIDTQSQIDVEYSFVVPDFVSADVYIVNNSTQQIVFERNEDDASTNPSGTAVLNLSAGTYKLVADIEGQTPASAFISVRGIPEVTYNPNFIIGGIRIKQTSDCPYVGAEDCVTRNYIYKNPILLDIPILNYDILVLEQSNLQVVYKDATTFVNNNQAAFSTYNGSHILYKTVEILEEGGQKGKMIQHYSGNTNANFTSTEQPFVPFLRRDWEKGRLIREEIYKFDQGTYTKIKETINTYESVYPFHNETLALSTLAQDVNLDKIVWGFVSIQDRPFPQNPILVPYTCIDQRDYYEVEFYAYLPQRYDLVSSVTTEDSIVSSQYYHYDNDFGQLKSVEIPRSMVGDTTIHTYRYPYDVSGTIYSGLVSENRIAKAVSLNTEHSPSESEISSIDYNVFNSNQIFPSETILEKSNSGGIIQTTFNDYTDNGKLAQYTITGGKTSSLIWGYNNQYPVASVENADSSAVSTAVTTALSSLANNYGTLQELLDSLGDINGDASQRTRWKDFNAALRDALPGAMVTTTTYDPLVGVTSMTDPRGNALYYAYDDFNRLESVRDMDNNLVSENEYNYKD